MLRPTTWRSRVTVLGLIAAWYLLGFAFAENGPAEMHLYTIGLCAATLAPLWFIGRYTLSGPRGRRIRAWWTNDVAFAVVVLLTAFEPLTAPLAWVFLRDHGQLSTSWLAWIEIAGPIATTAAIIYGGIVWVRAGRS